MHPIYLTNIPGQIIDRTNPPGNTHKNPNMAENNTKKQNTMPSSQVETYGLVIIFMLLLLKKLFIEYSIQTLNSKSAH